MKGIELPPKTLLQKLKDWYRRKFGPKLQTFRYRYTKTDKAELIRKMREAHANMTFRPPVKRRTEPYVIYMPLSLWLENRHFFCDVPDGVPVRGIYHDD